MATLVPSTDSTVNIECCIEVSAVYMLPPLHKPFTLSEYLQFETLNLNYSDLPLCQKVLVNVFINGRTLLTSALLGTHVISSVGEWKSGGILREIL